MKEISKVYKRTVVEVLKNQMEIRESATFRWMCAHVMKPSKHHMETVDLSIMKGRARQRFLRHTS